MAKPKEADDRVHVPTTPDPPNAVVPDELAVPNADEQRENE